MKIRRRLAFLFLLAAAGPTASSAAVWSTSTVNGAGPNGIDLSLALGGGGNPVFSHQVGATVDLQFALFTAGAWSLQTVDTAGNTGSQSAVAVGPDNNVHISYYDDATPALKYARWNGSSWTLETVETGGALHTSIALDGAGRAHISYFDEFAIRLKYARRDAAGWSIAVVDDAATGADTALALDAAGAPQIVYSDRSGSSVLRYARWTGATWALEAVAAATETPKALAVDGNGRPHIVYESQAHQLVYARRAGAGWSFSTIDNVWPDMGSEALALDGDMNVFTVYRGTGAVGTFKFARWDGAAWSTETVDNQDGGRYASLALGADDVLHIAYQQTSGSFVKYASATLMDVFAPLAGGNGKSPVGKPTGFAAAAVYSSSIAWQWFDNAVGEAGFRLYGATAAAGPYNLIAGTSAIAANAVAFTETGLTPGVTYYRYLAAVNDGGFAVSSPASVVTGPQGTTAPDQAQTFTADDGKVVLDIPANAFGDAYTVTINTNPVAAPLGSAALAAKILEANAKKDSPLPGGLVEILVRNAANASLGDALLSPPSLSLSFEMENGRVKGGAASLRPKTLAIYTLNEKTNLWVKLPSSQVDLANGKVTARVPHFSVFALIGAPDTSLDQAFVYPVPFQPSLGHTAITFTNLAQPTTIKIFTVSGRRVRTLQEPGGAGELDWDGKNEDGEPAASGVYFYVMESPTDKRTGKLMILR